MRRTRIRLRFLRRAGLAAGLLFLAIAPWAQPAESSGSAPPLRVTVDPRVELLSIIFRLAGNPEYSQGRVASYSQDVERHFKPFRDHPVVELARKLRRTRGVSFDAVMGMAVHLTDAGTLGEAVAFDPRPATLDNRWTVEEAREFLRLARQFVKDSDFESFFKRHRGLYETAESRIKALLDNEAHLDWFAEFFGQRPGARFTVAVGMLNGGSNYGARCRKDGREDLYCVLGVWKTDAAGLPAFDRTMLPTVVHEFCHSYANPIVDRHADDLQAAGEKLFPQVASSLRRQGYGHWKTMMYESLVRASTIRYLHRHEGAEAARRAIAGDKKRQFLWIEELSDLLAQYERQRDKYPTLEAFGPRIVAFFDEYAARRPEAKPPAEPAGVLRQIEGLLKGIEDVGRKPAGPSGKPGRQ